jgi:AraC family transcriptional regulator
MNALGPPSYAAWIMSEGFHPSVKEHREVGGLSASLFRVVQEEASPDPATPDISVQLLMGGSMHGSFDVGAGRFEGTMRAGDFCVGPDRVPLQLEGKGRSEFLVLALPGQKLRAMAQQASGRAFVDFGRLHAGLHRDERLATLLRWLWVEAEHEAAYGRLFADGALSMIVARLLALSEQPLRPSRGGLAPWQIKRVTRAMEEALVRDIGLADLAALVGLSPYHFARAFKASTGSAPHRYMMERRVERAKEMLAASDQSVTQIAHACGFASSQHMATVFRKVVGTTPTEYRRQRRL